MKIKNTIIPFLLLAMPIVSNAQDEDMFDDLLSSKEFVLTTFETTRLINAHTTEIVGKGSLDFRINHRFGDVNGGFREMFGLDQPGSIEIAFDYAYSERTQFGIGRTNLGKIMNGYVKHRIMRQTVEDENPLSITALAKVHGTIRKVEDNRYDKFSNRLIYTTQLQFARKFNKKLSMQVGPVWSHMNLVDSAQFNHDNLGVLFIGRYKFKRRAAITWEYNYRLNTLDNQSLENSMYRNSIGLGLELETGGHVFQMFFSNSQSADESQAYFKTTSDPFKGEWRLGFNISRVFAM